MIKSYSWEDKLSNKYSLDVDESQVSDEAKKLVFKNDKRSEMKCNFCLKERKVSLWIKNEDNYFQYEKIFWIFSHIDLRMYTQGQKGSNQTALL